MAERNRAVAFIFNRSLRVRWYMYIVVGVFYLGSWLIGKLASPRARFFVERDPALSYPFVSNTIPGWTLFFFGFVIPVVVILITLICLEFTQNKQLIHRRTRDLHLNIIVLVETLGVTNLITNLVKVLVGRLRPNFYAFCDYKGYRTSFETGNFTEYFENTVPGRIGDIRFCRLEENDAHFSFPSGHTSLTLCGLTFIVLFLGNISHQIRFPNVVVRNAVLFTIIFLPFIVGVLMAASRVIDYKHTVEDTAWGAIIGIFSCVMGYYAHALHQKPPAWDDKKKDVQLSNIPSDEEYAK